MKVIYEIMLKVTAVHEIDTLNELKDNSEYGEDIARVVCDEIATAGGVGSYEIIGTTIDVK